MVQPFSKLFPFLKSLSIHVIFPFIIPLKVNTAKLFRIEHFTLLQHRFHAVPIPLLYIRSHKQQQHIIVMTIISFSLPKTPSPLHSLLGRERALLSAKSPTFLATRNYFSICRSGQWDAGNITTLWPENGLQKRTCSLGLFNSDCYYRFFLEPVLQNCGFSQIRLCSGSKSHKITNALGINLGHEICFPKTKIREPEQLWK